MALPTRAMVKSNWAIDLFYALPEIRRRQCRVPTNSGLYPIILGRRETALPCPPSPTRAMVKSNWAMVKSNWAMVKSNWAIDRYYPLPKIRRLHVPCPYKSGNGCIELGDRYYPLPEIRRLHVPCPYNFYIPTNLFSYHALRPRKTPPPFCSS